jgi:hypothetical protein
MEWVEYGVWLSKRQVLFIVFVQNGIFDSCAGEG